MNGRRIVITGASSGIGLATAQLLGQEGARLALLARSERGLQAAAHAVRQTGSTAEIFPVDVSSDRPAVEAAVAQAAHRLEGIDVLIPWAAALVYGPFSELSPEDFDRCHDVTFRGVVNTVRAGLPELECSQGAIVAVVSMASKVPIPLHSAYVAASTPCAAFSAHCGWSCVIAARPCASMVHPAFIGTPFFDHATSALETRPHPLRPVYRPEDVAAAVLACTHHPHAELNVGASAVASDFLTRFARPVSHLVLATYGVAGQRRPDPAARPGMLWEPSGEGRTTGTVAGRRSVWTTLRLATQAPRGLASKLPVLGSAARFVQRSGPTE